jgi:hypothetical protein
MTIHYEVYNLEQVPNVDSNTLPEQIQYAEAFGLFAKIEAATPSTTWQAFWTSRNAEGPYLNHVLVRDATANYQIVIRNTSKGPPTEDELGQRIGPYELRRFVMRPNQTFYLRADA